MKEYDSHTELPTYVFVDVSNIRSSCLKTLGFKIDFHRLLEYFRHKYPDLQNVYYYEGIATGDTDKSNEFDELSSLGYTIRQLERKAYINPPVYKEIRCKKCGAVRKVCVLKKATRLKSNIDVYLATDLLKIAYSVTEPLRIVLVSCDGDYAEMIKSAIETNPKIRIDVLATPVVPRVLNADGTYEDNNNTCSTRLQKLRGVLPNFTMINIQDIRDYIKQK